LNKSNKVIIAGWVILLLAGCASRAKGQFVNLNLKVESKVTTKRTHPLHFKSVNVNSGHQSINWGSARMGTFHITALKHQSLLIRLDKPRFLYHEGAAFGSVIPVQLHVRYSYASHEPDDAVLLRSTPVVITLHTGHSAGPWRTVYLFIYGSLRIENVPAGIYSNKMVITLAYL
jgi:hypothetical protein